MKLPVCVFEVGSVVSIRYPYEDSKKSKIRPAVVIDICDNKITVVTLKISSREKYGNETKYPYAIEIKDITSAGLTKTSWVLADKELQIESNCQLQLKGHLSADDLEAVKIMHNAAILSSCIVQLKYTED